MSDQSKKLEFIQMYTVKGLSPLQLDVGIGQTYTKNFSELGLYGDRYFVYYSQNGLGKAFYEKDEMEKTALQGKSYFSDPEKFLEFQQKTRVVLEKAKQFIEKFSQIDLSKLDYPQLVDLAIERIRLEEEAFIYYDATEPQITGKIEEKVNFYLMKILSGQKYNDYSAKLTLSDRENTLSEEELEWLKIVKIGKELELTQISIDTQSKQGEFYNQLENHFKKYQQLTIGDDSWVPDISYFYNKYKEDSKRDVEELNKRIAEIKSYPVKVSKEKEEIIAELNLDPEIVMLCKVLSDIGHVRLQLRIDGWTMIASYSTPIDKELMARLGISYEQLHSKTRKEYEELIKSGKPKGDVTADSLPVSYKKDFLYWIDDGQIEVLYGKEAALAFEELIPQEDLSGISAVKGNIAMTGKATGKVCIYSWGDNLEGKLKEMEENKILVTGMTRPQLMPLIYKAKAIVTDQGGVTSHAAIVSRELGIPCVIGTKNATGVFKPGEEVEVNADEGIVRKI